MKKLKKNTSAYARINGKWIYCIIWDTSIKNQYCVKLPEPVYYMGKLTKLYPVHVSNVKKELENFFEKSVDSEKKI